MLAVAGRYPLDAWTGIDPEMVYRQYLDLWQTQGVRPANHPRRRLRQYAEWVAARHDWPHRVVSQLGSLSIPGQSLGTAHVRRLLHLGETRRRFAAELTGERLGGTRLDNLVCDGLLPLLAVREDRDLQPIWFNWFAGDMPAEVRTGLVAVGLAGRDAGPQCQGWAQGLLAWILERDARASG